MLKKYLGRVFEAFNRGDAREESYYTILEDLLKDYAKLIDKPIDVRTLPKQTEAGNPDFRIWSSPQEIIGYIEAKAPTVKNLDEIEHTEQLKRYLENFSNLILTNFLEFRLYRKGKLIDSVSIARSDTLLRFNFKPPVEHEKEFKGLLEKFFSFTYPRDYTAETLAQELAKRTHFLKDVIASEFEQGKTAGNASLSDFYDTFKKYLISDLLPEQFVDLFAQTITYGLFAARMRSDNGFGRTHAYEKIPKTIGILRELFKFISIAEDLPKQMEWTIDDIASVLAVADVKSIFENYYHSGKGEDPVMYFYETFLSTYNPREREKRGVYYTPAPVVKYIVNSVNEILKAKLGIANGLADNRVTVLDPAAGTLSFVTESIKCAVSEYIAKFGEGGKSKFIQEHILNDFYAFELMMAPYAIGHIKFSYILEEEGYKMKDDERPKFYLTNTLDMKVLEPTQFPMLKAISEESHLADKVKKEIPILVVMGNPPYSVSSMNKSKFIEKEMETYKEDVKSETNIQPLSDDYIKFIRFAHWKIDQSKKGIIGMITNNSYLSGIIHRGMRKKLLESFDEIYILNLHGNSRIGEKCPDGSKDENVFDIMQGVSISLFIKNGHQKGLAKVYYQDIFGERKDKYIFLEANSLRRTNWKELNPIKPYYFFVEKEFSRQEEYEKFLSVFNIFGQDKFSSGVKTHRDNFVVGFNKEEVEQRILTFTSDLSSEVVREGLKLKDTTDWKLDVARERVKKIDWRKYIRQYAYRPFDIRYICYIPDLIDRDRHEIMQNFFEENLGLVTTRLLTRNATIFHHAFVDTNIIDIGFLSSKTSETTYIFPLYVFPFSEDSNLYDEDTKQKEKVPNLNDDFLKQLNETYKADITPEQIFYYIYAVLYSNTYREKYAEFLKIDFPRIPFTKDYETFKSLSALGEELVNLHLLKSPKLSNPIAKYSGTGEDAVEKVKYVEQEHRVYINPNKYFENIMSEVFAYQIGGYQVLNKWLKDRTGRVLTLSEIEQYCKIVTALSETIELQKQIDEVYESVEKTI